ncbi:MAG: hypothetical protein PGN13_07265 [Patulibacter minatonensis]
MPSWSPLPQLSFSFGVAVIGIVFFDVIEVPHLPADALAVTALATHVPLAFSFVLAFRLPPRAREGAAAHRADGSTAGALRATVDRG